MMAIPKKYKTREELSKWSDVELFAYALNNGISNTQRKGNERAKRLSYSHCYGQAYSETKIWEISYGVDDNGFPCFGPEAREILYMLLCGEHMIAWNALQEAERAKEEALRAHKAFLRSYV